jgi:hypothetical protein
MGYTLVIIKIRFKNLTRILYFPNLIRATKLLKKFKCNDMAKGSDIPLNFETYFNIKKFLGASHTLAEKELSMKSCYKMSSL